MQIEMFWTHTCLILMVEISCSKCDYVFMYTMRIHVCSMHLSLSMRYTTWPDSSAAKPSTTTLPSSLRTRAPYII